MRLADLLDAVMKTPLDPNAEVHVHVRHFDGQAWSGSLSQALVIRHVGEGILSLVVETEQES